MKKLIWILVLTLTYSCQKKSEVTYTKQRVVIKPTWSGVDNLKIIKWRVGLMRNLVISRGVQITIRLPQLEKKDLKYLVDKFGVDSWIIKVKRKGMMRYETMGYFYIPLILPGQRNAMRINQMKAGSFKVYYASSAVSERLSNLPCPAFKHDLKIEKVEIQDSKPLINHIIVSPAEESRILSRVEEFSYSNTVLNGGKELRGDYFIEIAFYNKGRKNKLSNFVELNGTARVLRERSNPIAGCESFRIPPFKEGEDLRQKFKWNK
ncbi:hypothetical protein A9Q84_07750 [Halobacteriovorax marinus]|uniref:Lipoprotein n=1 Tax=Halobacteriovorax marinus TaxID=97084 RepID=A0A1Y5F5S8_9BACT|nr:hypothetical protein A9Q84_07750 [Halobacteriovorax marinus]